MFVPRDQREELIGMQHTICHDLQRIRNNSHDCLSVSRGNSSSRAGVCVAARDELEPMRVSAYFTW